MTGFVDELLAPEASYSPYGKAGPAVNAHQLPHVVPHGVRHPAKPATDAGHAHHVARLVAALLASRGGSRR